VAHKIINKFKEPKFAEFSRKDLVIDIKNGILYYKSNLGVHRISSGLSTDTFGSGDITNITNFNVGIPATFKGDGIRIGDSSITGELTITGNNVTSGSIIINESASFGSIIPHPGLDIPLNILIGIPSASAPYSGSITASNNSNQISGSNLAFNNIFKSDDLIKITNGAYNQTFRIDNIHSNTSMSLDSNWVGDSISGSFSGSATNIHTAPVLSFFKDPDLLTVKASDGRKELVLDKDGNLDIHGSITTDLTNKTNLNIVYVDALTGELTQDSTSSFMDRFLVVHSSAISGSSVLPINNLSQSVATSINNITTLNTFKATGHRDGNSVITGSLLVTDTITAQEFHTEFISSSIIFQTGSTKFGDSIDDTHRFTGTISVSGSGVGHITASGDISSSGRLYGALSSSTSDSIVYYNNITGELTHHPTGSLFDNSNILSSSQQIDFLIPDILSSSQQIDFLIPDIISSSQQIDFLTPDLVSSSTQIADDISGSWQSQYFNTLTAAGITGSWSSQYFNTLTAAGISGSWQGQNFISGSQVTENLPEGTISSSNQITSSYSTLSAAGISGSIHAATSSILNDYGLLSSSAQLPEGILSSSQQIDFLIPDIISSSQQIDFLIPDIISSSIQLPSGIISSSAQLPEGILSSSQQIDFLIPDIISSSTQISTDISGAFTIISASIATNIETNVTNIVNLTNVTSSYVVNSQTSSYVVNSQTSSFVVNSLTSSFVVNSQTGSFALSSQTSSYVVNSQTSSFVVNSLTSSFVVNSQTSSYVVNSQTGSFALSSQTSSYVVNSQTSSFVTNSQTSSFLDTFKSTGQRNGNSFITGSLGVGAKGANLSLGTLVISQSTDSKTQGLSIHQMGNGAKGYIFITGSRLAIQSGFTGTAGTTINPSGTGKVAIGRMAASSTLDVDGDLRVRSHITASGNISVSGFISASTAVFPDLVEITQQTAVYYDRISGQLSYGNVTSPLGVSASIHAATSSILNDYGLLSSSAQLPEGILSSSQQIDFLIPDLISSSTQLPSGIISSSQGLDFLVPNLISSSIQLPSGIISSSQGLDFLVPGILSSSTQLPAGILSSSQQIDFLIPDILSSSQQIDYLIPDLISSSTQLPSGIISSSQGLDFLVPNLISSSIQLPSGIISSSQGLDFLVPDIISSSTQIDNFNKFVINSQTSSFVVNSQTGSFLLNTTDTLTGVLTVSGSVLINKSDGEGTPTIGTSNVTTFQNNDAGQNASIAIISAGSQSSRIHFGKHDDIEVGGIRYFHEDHLTLPNQMRFRINNSNVIIFANNSNRGAIGVGGGGVATDYFHAQGILSGGGLTVSSSNGATILLKGANTIATIDRTATDKKSILEFNTAETTKWTLGNIAESDDNFYLYNGDGQTDKHISLTPTSTNFLTSISASGDITASGIISASVSIMAPILVGNDTNEIQLSTTNRIDLNPNGSVAVRLSDSSVDLNKNTKVNGHITASGNISASGDLTANNITSSRAILGSGEYLSWGSTGTTAIEGSTVSNKINFLTNGSSQMFLNSTGLGIGTTAPTEKLQVTGNISASGFISASSANLSSLPNLVTTSSLFYNENTGEIYYGTAAPAFTAAGISGSIYSALSFITGSGILSSSQGLDFLIPDIISSSTQISNFNTFVVNSQTSSFIVNSQTSSFVVNSQTSSFVVNSQTGSFLLNTTDTLTGDLTVTGTITAQEFHTEFVSASIMFSSGSTKFGDTQDDTHTLTGSLNVTGSIDVRGTGDISVSNNISASKDILAERFLVDGKVAADYNGTTVLLGNTTTPLTLRGTLTKINQAGGLFVSAGHITASKNISASGTIHAAGGTMSDNITFDGNKGIHFQDTGTQITGNSQSITIEGDNSVNILGDVSVVASAPVFVTTGNISASGNLFLQASDNNDSDFKTLVYDASTGKVFITGSYGGSGGSLFSAEGISGSLLGQTASIAVKVSNNLTLSSSGNNASGLSYEKITATSANETQEGFNGSTPLLLKVKLHNLKEESSSDFATKHQEESYFNDLVIAIGSGSTNNSTRKIPLKTIFENVAGTGLIYTEGTSTLSAPGPTGTVSSSALSTTGQGLVRLTTNNIAQTAVGLGLETTDSVTFSSIDIGSVGALSSTTDQFRISSSGNLIFNADSDNNSNGNFDNIIFQTKGSERMRISGSGNIGIGTALADKKLVVAAGVTGNADISASGKLFAGLAEVVTPHTLYYNRSGGELSYGESPASFTAAGISGSIYSALSFITGSEILSSSQQIDFLVPDIISSSQQIDFLVPDIISSSQQIDFLIPDILSSSQQIDFLIPDILSSSTQISNFNTFVVNSQTGSFLLNTTDTLDGNLTVTGTITAQEFHTEFVSASIIFQSGSTKFGDTQDDTHTLTGSLNVTGSIDVIGTITASGDISASGHLFGKIRNNDDVNFETVVYNPLNGKLFSTGSYGGGGGGSGDDLGNHTAIQDLDMNNSSISNSLHITASGTGSFGHIRVEGSGDRDIKVISSGTSNNSSVLLRQSNDTGYDLIYDGGVDKFQIKQQDGKLPFQIKNGSPTNTLYLHQGGNVGIGTTTPTEKLTVVGNISASGTISGSNLSGTNTGDQDLSSFLTNSQTSSFVQNSTTSSFITKTRITVINSLNTNIDDDGGSTAAHKFVEGNSITVSGSSSGNDPKIQFSFNPGGVDGGVYFNSGNDLMGTPTSNFSYDGSDLSVSGDIIAFASDKRLKENIVEILNPIEKIQQLRGVTYDWKDEALELGVKTKRQYNEIGLIAQELEKVIPQAVTRAPFDNENNEKIYLSGNRIDGEAEPYKTIKMDKVVPLLIEAIKDQQKQIDELKKLISK